MRYSHEDYDEAIRRAKAAAEEARHISYEQTIRRGEQTSSEESGRSCGAITVRGGKVLAAIRKTEDGYGEICGPGGGIHEGESPIDGAKRELAEEFGLKAKSICPLRCGEEEDRGERPYLFLCTKFEGDPKCKDGELESPMFLSMEELAAIRSSCFKPFYESIEYLNKALRYDDEEDEERDRGQESGGHGNTRLPYGLCQRYGIELPSGATPHDAWVALAGKGITPESAYKTLKETGSAEGIGQEIEQSQETEQTQETGTTGQAQGNEEAQPQEVGQEEQESEEAQTEESEGAQTEEGEQGQEAEDPRLKEMNDKFKDLEEKAMSGEIDTDLYSDYANDLKKLVGQVTIDDVIVVDKTGFNGGREYWHRKGRDFLSDSGDCLRQETLADKLRYDKDEYTHKSVTVVKKTGIEKSLRRELDDVKVACRKKADDMVTEMLNGMADGNMPSKLAWIEAANDMLYKQNKPITALEGMTGEKLEDERNGMAALNQGMLFGTSLCSLMNSGAKRYADAVKEKYNKGAFMYHMYGDAADIKKILSLLNGEQDVVQFGGNSFSKSLFDDGQMWGGENAKETLKKECRYLLARIAAYPDDTEFSKDETDKIIAKNDARIKSAIQDELGLMQKTLDSCEKFKESGDAAQAKGIASLLRKDCRKLTEGLEAGDFGGNMLIDDKCEAEVQAFRDISKQASEYCRIDPNKQRYELPDLPIDKAKGAEKFDESSYSQERKDAAKWCQSPEESVKAYGKQACKAYKNASQEERTAVYNYTDGSGKFNRPLSGYHGTWKREDYKGVGRANLNHEGAEKQISELTDFLGRNSFNEDIWVQHGFDSRSGFAAFLGLETWDVSEDNINDLIDSGCTCHWSSFMSCGAAKNTGFDKCAYVLNIYCPKGTKGAYIAPGSRFGGSHDFTGTPPPPVEAGHENELLLQRDGNYRITKCEKKGTEYYLDVEVINQEPFDYSDYVYHKPE